MMTKFLYPGLINATGKDKLLYGAAKYRKIRKVRIFGRHVRFESSAVFVANDNRPAPPGRKVALR